MTNCFLTGESDCELVEIFHNGQTYMIKEEITDNNSFKKLKELINIKVAENQEKEKLEAEEAQKKKTEALDQLKGICETLGVDAKQLGSFLLGNTAPSHESQTKTPSPTSVDSLKNQDDGFREVDGSLSSSLRAKVTVEEGVGASMPAYTTVKDGDKTIKEEQKKVKRIDDGTVVERSNMGTTILKIDHHNGNELTRILSEVDENGNLVRAAVAGSGTNSGQKTVDCPLCGGTGIARIGHQTCKKCNGAGVITAG